MKTNKFDWFIIGFLLALVLANVAPDVDAWPSKDPIIQYIEDPDKPCPSMRKYLVLCPKSLKGPAAQLNGTSFAMKCERWSAIVEAIYDMGIDNFSAAMQQQLKDRTMQENIYIGIYAGKALEYLEGREFKNKDHAYSLAMKECGVWSET